MPRLTVVPESEEDTKSGRGVEREDHTIDLCISPVPKDVPADTKGCERNAEYAIKSTVLQPTGLSVSGIDTLIETIRSHDLVSSAPKSNLNDY